MMGTPLNRKENRYEFFIDVLLAKIKAGHIICAPLSMLSLPKPQLIQA
jgi:hypothetical protein